ncbi:MAG: hypothetical protein IIA51_10230 [Chloroflexi bacterium]|nr:hypothetical protein [Chloroflexota bacterium]
MIERIARIYHSFHGARILVLLAVASSGCQAGARSTEGTLAALSTESADLGTQIAAQATLITHLATRGPPRITQPVGTLQPTPYEPVRGFVEIEEGACCVGGKAGDSLEIGTAFQASSPLGEVTQMRVRFGSRPFAEEQLTAAEWEPFVPLKVFHIEIVINWVGYYVSVQYMDENGNLSAVYQDDISVEGHP